jgi:hypothetical protein
VDVRAVARAGVVAALAIALLLVHVGMQAGDGHPVAPAHTMAAAHQAAPAHQPGPAQQPASTHHAPARHRAAAAPVEPADPAGDTHLMASLCLAILAGVAVVTAFRATRARGSLALDDATAAGALTWHVARGRPPDPGRLRIDTGTVLLV